MSLNPEPSPKTPAKFLEAITDQPTPPSAGLHDFLAAPQIAWLRNVFPSTDAQYLAAFHAVANPDALVSFLALPDYAALKNLLAIQEPVAQQAFLNKMLPVLLSVATPPALDSDPADQESAQQHQPPETAAMMFPEVHSPAGEGSGGGGSVTLILQSSPQGSPELPGAVGAQGGSSGSMSQLELSPQAEVNPGLSHGDSGFISSGGEEVSVLEDLGGANLNEAVDDIAAQAEPPVVPENLAGGAAANGVAGNNLAPALANLLAVHPEMGAGDADGSGVNGSSGTIFHLQHVAQHGMSPRALGFAVAGGLGVVGAIVAAVVLSVDNDHQNDDNNGATPSPQIGPIEVPVAANADAVSDQSDEQDEPLTTAAMLGPESGAPGEFGNFDWTVQVESEGATPVEFALEADASIALAATPIEPAAENFWSSSQSNVELGEHTHHSFDNADASQDGSGSDIVAEDVELSAPEDGAGSNIVPEDFEPPAPEDGSGSDIVAEDFELSAPEDGAGGELVAEDFSPPAPQDGFLGGNAQQDLNPPGLEDSGPPDAGQHELDEWELPQQAGDNSFSVSLSDSGSRSPSPSFGFGVDTADPVTRITAGVLGVVGVSTAVALGVVFGTEDDHASDDGADPAVAPAQNAIPLATLWVELAVSGVESGAAAGAQQAPDGVAAVPDFRTSLQNWLSENVPALIVNLAGFDTMSVTATPDAEAVRTVYVNIELSAKDTNAVAGQLAMSDLSTILASLRDYDTYAVRSAAPDWHVQYMGMDVISGEILRDEALAADDGGSVSDYSAASDNPLAFADIASNAAAPDGNVALEINGVQTTLWSM